MEIKKSFEGSALVYDLLYSDKNYDSEVSFIERQFKNGKHKSLLELGCGTGNYLSRFHDKGYDITGLDISKEMLDIAKKKSDCKLIQGDIRDYKIDEKFDVILAMFDVLSYVNSNQDVVKTLRNAREHLKYDGLFISQVWNGLGVLHDGLEQRTKEKEDIRFKVVRSVDPVLRAEEHVVDVNYKYDIFDKTNKEHYLIKETHPMRFFFPQEMKYFLENNGFEVLTMSDFMNIDKKVDEKTWHLFSVAKRR